MKRIVLISLVVAFLAACQDSQIPTRPDGSPLFDVFDGASQPQGNVDVFFLPPLVETPHGPDVGDRPADDDLDPVARICRLNVGDFPPAEDPDLVAPVCVEPIVDLAMTFGGGYYSVNWQTDDPSQTGGAPLDTDFHYRIEIFLGPFSLEAYRDIDPDPGPPRGSCTRRDAFCQINNGSNVPIKVIIETFAACIALDPTFEPDDPNALCATANLAAGESLALRQNGGGDIAVATVNNAGTINMRSCPDLRDRTARNGIAEGLVDIPTFGDCVDIATLEDFLVTGTATLCDAFDEAIAANVSAAQAARMTVHRFGSADDASTALPHSPAAVCNQGSSIDANTLTQFAMQVRNNLRDAWRAGRDQVLMWVAPRPLLAKVARCHRGCGSPSNFESHFEVALPSWMAFHTANPGGDLGVHDAGNVVTGKVQLWDSGELEPPGATSLEPVNNVRLTVTVTGGTGGVSDVVGGPFVNEVTIFSGADPDDPDPDLDGVAAFYLQLGPGTNTVEVSGIGVGTAGQAGTHLNVFAPSLEATAGEFPLGIGTLTFTASTPVLEFDPDPPTTDPIYMGDNREALIPPITVCAVPRIEGVEITTMVFIKNNGDPVEIGGFEPSTTAGEGGPIPGCVTFSNITINKTGAYRIVVNGVFISEKINVKPPNKKL